MSKKQFFLVLAASCFLFFLFLVLDRQEKEGLSKNEARSLFSDLKSDSIAKINLGSKDQTIDLKLEGGTWSVSSRSSYPADVNHVRSLLLNILDLSVSQKITSNKERHQALGLSDEDYREQVTFFTADDKPLGGLLLGKERKKKLEPGREVSAGRYVRRLGEKEVFLAAQSMDLEKDAYYWLDSNLSNFLAIKLASVRKYKVLEDGKEEVIFELLKDGEDSFKLSSQTLSDKEMLDPAALAKATSALENARLKDVYKSDSEQVKGLVFETKSVFQGQNGLVYTALSAKKDDRHYLKLSVGFVDHALPRIAPSPSDKNAAVSSSKTPSPTNSPAVSKEELLKEAETLNARYSPWVYEIEEYQAAKFGVALGELVKPKVQEVEDGKTAAK